MLKLLHKDDTQNTPFVVTKNWELSNVLNEDSVLMEVSGSDGPPVALEYLTLLPNNAVTASNPCNVALEQQADDLVSYRDGTKLTGIFYPETDPTNLDGTFQRVVYAQVVKMFYNDYRDPTKIWGLERIDFDTSQTKRFLADKFKMFQIPQIVYGEKVIPNTVVMYDKTTDNDYIITDDGNCNLFAGTNLFSHQQEVGEYLNQFASGSSDACDFYYGPTGSVVVGPLTFFDSDSGLFYGLGLSGSFGMEVLSITGSSQNNSSIVCLFDPTSSAYYSLDVQGVVGSETLTIVSSGLTQVTPVVLFNPTNQFQYNLYIGGPLGSEYIYLVPSGSIPLPPCVEDVFPAQLFTSSLSTSSSYDLV